MTAVKRKITFSNGRVFKGIGFGSMKDAIAPVIFNTSMVGYQEILSDPASFGQIILMTYPLIGNYGLADEDYESRLCSCKGLIVREYNDIPSNYRYTKTLQDVMEDYHTPGICNVDTRQITQMLRREGSLTAMITHEEVPHEEIMENLENFKQEEPLVPFVSCKKRWYARTANFKYNVVALDLGIKQSIIKTLNSKGCNVIVVPYNTPLGQIMALRPDGLLISDGPGSVKGLEEIVELLKSLQGSLPILAIGLGHQLLALANGGNIVPMVVGHHGGNHPVKNLSTGKVDFTSQGHQWVVEKSTFPKGSLHITHVNVIDQSVEGMVDEKRGLLGVQYHPEGAPGPKDSLYWFDHLIAFMEKYQKERGALNG